MNALEFFKKSSGVWKSQRTTHHLAFKRAEQGGSQITVEAFEKENPRIISLCELHEVDPSLAIGGAYVSWCGTMQWDREEGEQHEGETVFALVPDDETGRNGRLLREKGYAEVMPVVGHYEMDEEDGLVLITEYETMSARERFWFANDYTRVRTSTVKRFGGFSTATFCTETRIGEAPEIENPDTVSTPVPALFGW
jgi:hypothetical protein